MHNEFVGKRAPRAAAFVCFKAAEEGGEFLLGNGRKILAELSTELAARLYERKIRYSVRAPQDPPRPPERGSIRARSSHAAASSAPPRRGLSRAPQVMELPFFGWIDSLPGPLQPPVMAAIKAAATAALNAKVRAAHRERSA